MGKTVKVLLTAAGVMGASALLLLAGAALVLSKAGFMPWDFLPLLTTALCCAAVFAGGLTASLLSGERGLWYGLGCGALFAACLGAAAFFTGQTFGPAALGKLAALLLSGAIGGVLGVNRKKRVKF